MEYALNWMSVLELSFLLRVHADTQVVDGRDTSSYDLIHNSSCGATSEHLPHGS